MMTVKSKEISVVWQYSVLRTAQSISHPTPRQTCSMKCHLFCQKMDITQVFFFSVGFFQVGPGSESRT